MRSASTSRSATLGHSLDGTLILAGIEDAVTLLLAVLLLHCLLDLLTLVVKWHWRSAPQVQAGQQVQPGRQSAERQAGQSEQPEQQLPRRYEY